MSYNPAIGKVRDFAIKESTGETKGVFPYKGSKKKVELKAINFDWESPDPRISFRDSKILAFDGSIGYGIGGGRVELEVGYEKFKTKGVKRGDGDEEGIYLLAKDLAYNVALNRTEDLTKGIKGLQKQELRKVAEDIKTFDGGSTIDSLICKTGTNDASWSNMTTSGDKHANVVDGTKCPTKQSLTGSGSTSPGLMVVVSPANQPTDSGFTDTTKMEILPNTSTKISKDILALTNEQKGKVSSAFAKAHEGAEIVEIRSISTTSVMVNACYDVLAEGLPVSPYGCAVHSVEQDIHQRCISYKGC